MPRFARLFQFTVMEDSGCSVMARVRNPSGGYITQASLDSISVTYRSLNPSGSATTSGLTVSQCVFDTLQTDSRWAKDATGYNFRWDAPATIFTRGGARYVVTFLFTPASGAAFKVSGYIDVQPDVTG